MLEEITFNISYEAADGSTKRVTKRAKDLMGALGDITDFKLLNFYTEESDDPGFIDLSFIKSRRLLKDTKLFVGDRIKTNADNSGILTAPRVYVEGIVHRIDASLIIIEGNVVSENGATSPAAWGWGISVYNEHAWVEILERKRFLLKDTPIKEGDKIRTNADLNGIMKNNKYIEGSVTYRISSQEPTEKNGTYFRIKNGALFDSSGGTSNPQWWGVDSNNSEAWVEFI